VRERGSGPLRSVVKKHLQHDVTRVDFLRSDFYREELPRLMGSSFVIL